MSRIDKNFDLTEALGFEDENVTPDRQKSAVCTDKRLNTMGKSECRAQPLWRSSPGTSMSVYQTAFWDQDVITHALLAKRKNVIFVIL